MYNFFTILSTSIFFSRYYSKEMVSLFWSVMTMMMFVCEKEVCLLCAGVECERSVEREVRSRATRSEREGNKECVRRGPNLATFNL